MDDKTADIVYKVIQRTVSHFLYINPHLLKRFSEEDLTQECFLHILEKGIISKYNPQKATFKYFLSKCTKNKLIDIYRQGFDNFASLDEFVGGLDTNNPGDRRSDLLESFLTNQYSAVLIQQLLKNCPDTPISPNIETTWRDFLGFFVQGYQSQEIHKMLNVTEGRVSQLRKTLMEKLNFSEAYAA